MLAVAQIDVHKAGHQGHNKDGQQEIIANGGQPTGPGILVDNTDFTGTLGNLPNNDEVGGELHGDVVHHQGEQGLIGVPLGLEEGGQEAPNGTGHQRSDERNHDQQRRGNLVTQQDHAAGGGQAADHRLTLGADVPKAHLEGGGHGQGDTQQNGHITEGHADAAGGAECAGENGGIHAEGIFAGEDRGDQATENQRQQQNTAADQKRLGQRQCITLRNLK